jgi:hypothetical protein
MAEHETQQAKLVRILGCTEEEAQDIIETDKAIDHGKKVYFDLSPEQEKVAKKFTNVREHRKKPITFDTKPRERKANATKGGLIAEIATFLEQNSQFSIENLEIVNKEKLITFSIGDKSYKLDLIQSRTKK